MKNKFQFRVKKDDIEHIINVLAEDKFKAFTLLDAMYPREKGYSHSLIFNDEVCG